MRGYIPCKVVVPPATLRQEPKETYCYIKTNQIVAIQQGSIAAYTEVLTTTGDVFHVIMPIGDFVKKLESASAR